MRKKLFLKSVLLLSLVGIFVPVLLIGAVLFWDPIIDALPIDQSGWSMNESGRVYLDEDGDPIVGWLNIDGKRYYFDAPGGAMHIGWLEESRTQIMEPLLKLRKAFREATRLAQQVQAVYELLVAVHPEE